MRRALLLTAFVLAACPAPAPPPDAGVEVDSGPPPVSCSAPEGCRLAGAPGVCRQGECKATVPCGDDLECGLGERCVGGACAFTGCTANADCATGRCLTNTYTCVECGANADCPREHPVCDTGSNTCVQCSADEQCTEPGPAHCSSAGTCVHCTSSDHCPNGLSCSGGVCVGATKGAACPTGISCAAGLVCVTLNSNQVCLESCPIYQPQCPGSQICYKLTYSGSGTLVFESGGPIGVCYDPQPNARGLHEACARNATGGNCQPNLYCVPDSASVALCRSFCDPAATGNCPTGEVCTGFVGDYSGRRYGLCLPDNGFGLTCSNDQVCRANLSCQAYEDPSASMELGPICQFNVGTKPGLAPCAPQALADGGVVTADRTCKSGACKGDPLAVTSPNYFCYAACVTDMDCTVGTRTGVCDGTFDFTTAYGTAGTMKGCRPGCASESTCAEYDAGVTCRLRLNASTTNPTFAATCSPPQGVKRAGEPCSSSVECRSGYCWLDDSRGVRRAGFCLEACGTGTDCTAALAAIDGGTATPIPLACQSTALLGYRGYDGVPQTGDDRFVAARLCTGVTCTSDSDCRPDGGTSRCVPDTDPSALNQGQVVLRCRTTTTGIKQAGEICAADSECETGVCGTLRPPSTGSGRVCFQACTGATTCPGTTTCRVGGLQVGVSGGPATVDSCAP